MTKTTWCRAHDEVPADVPGEMPRQMCSEWVRLNSDSTIARQVTAWAKSEPVLEGMRRPADVVDAIDAGDNNTKDAILIALIRLFQAGQAVAGRVVLQAMLPKVFTRAKSSVTLALAGSSMSDRLQLVVGEFWLCLIDYPVAIRPHRVAANLDLDTWHQLIEMKNRPSMMVPADPQVLAGMLEERSVVPSPQVTDTVDLAQLLRVAQDHTDLSPDVVALLRSVYVDEHPHSPTARKDITRALYAVAEREGVAPEAMRQRLCRAKQALLKVGPELVQVLA